jgi:beta-aspartyl-dipeptidase (metallo-type)
VARHLRLSQKGELRVGADADLVVLGKDHQVKDVMCGGQFFVRDERVVRPGMFEKDPT